MVEHEVFTQVEASFGRCLADNKFFDRFYEIFITSHADILPMFAKTDMAKQKHLLRHGLMSALMFVEGDAMARSAIDRIRNSHGAQRLNIRPELYRFWLKSIVQTVAECDPEYTPELARHWNDVLSPAVQRIQSGYQV